MPCTRPPQALLAVPSSLRSSAAGDGKRYAFAAHIKGQVVMTTDDEDREYRQFQVDLLNSKFKGTHTETEMIERLIELYRKGNRHARRGLENAKLILAPDSRASNSIWKTGAIYDMVDVASPTQSGPAGTDHFGLWRPNDKEKK